MQIFHVRLNVPDENRQRFLEAARELEAAVQNSDGCVYFRFLESITEPSAFAVMEEWEDADAVAKHAAQPYVARYNAAVSGLVDSSDVALFDVASSTHV